MPTSGAYHWFPFNGKREKHPLRGILIVYLLMQLSRPAIDWRLHSRPDESHKAGYLWPHEYERSSWQRWIGPNVLPSTKAGGRLNNGGQLDQHGRHPKVATVRRAAQSAEMFRE
jgi:hypothetical protein